MSSQGFPGASGPPGLAGNTPRRVVVHITCLLTNTFFQVVRDIQVYVERKVYQAFRAKQAAKVSLSTCEYSVISSALFQASPVYKVLKEMRATQDVQVSKVNLVMAVREETLALN